MIFTTEKVSDTMRFIKRDENVVAGSLLRVGDRWQVQILWMGPTGDIEYDAPSLEAAEAFVAGAGCAFEAMGANKVEQ